MTYPGSADEVMTGLAAEHEVVVLMAAEPYTFVTECDLAGLGWFSRLTAGWREAFGVEDAPAAAARLIADVVAIHDRDCPMGRAAIVSLDFSPPASLVAEVVRMGGVGGRVSRWHDDSMPRGESRWLGEFIDPSKPGPIQ